MHFNPPFPNGSMPLILQDNGFQESDILDIREMLLKEIKRQNQESCRSHQVYTEE